MDRRAAAILGMVAITIPTLLAIHAVRRMEAENAPRVIQTTSANAERGSPPRHPTGERR
jgi:hypothetical protein